MQDSEIVKLYFERDDKAIIQTEKQYSNYCRSIARRILGDSEDVEECLNDTYLKAWNSIPPNKPQNLAVYLGRIIRNISIDIYRKKAAEKRGGTQTEEILDELSELTNGKDETFDGVRRKELIKEINTFLSSLKPVERKMFVLRYWHAYSVSDISEKCGKSESNVSVSLSRTRKKMKEYLTERGFEI